METLFKHTWVLFIAVTVANAFFLKAQSKKYIEKKPELQKGYDAYFKGILLYGNIPWVLMAIGNLSGITNNTLDYLNPRTLNPIVLLFHTATLVLWAVAAWWIYTQSGAEFIEQHPGLFRGRDRSKDAQLTAKQVKAFFPFLLLAGIVGMVMMWMKDVLPTRL